MPAEEWHPYLSMPFITPPFPCSLSGHATVSGACSKILALFTGSDVFGVVEKRKYGELTEVDAGEEITLSLPTWSATADMAALARALSGYHITIDNEVGLKVGREIAVWSWPKFASYFHGTAARQHSPHDVTPSRVGDTTHKNDKDSALVSFAPDFRILKKMLQCRDITGAC